MFYLQTLECHTNLTYSGKYPSEQCVLPNLVLPHGPPLQLAPTLPTSNVNYI